MTSDVVLSAALRTNLLSLQNTQSSIDITQNRLATGKKINSALDGPQAFFASQALTNRASDLTRLLDGIGQSIQVIKAADNGITALTALVEQADSLATQARDALSAGEAEAKVTGDVDLRDIDDITTDLSGVGATDVITFTITDPTDTTNTTTANITTAAQTIESFITSINDIRDADGAKVIEASLDAGGKLEIRSTNGGDLSVNFVSNGDTDPENLALAQAFGFGDVARLVDNGDASSDVKFAQVAKATLDSLALVGITSTETATRSTLIDDVEDADGTALFAGLAVGDTLEIRLNGGATAETIDLDDGTNANSIQSIIDQINSNANLEGKIEASFDEDTGVFSIQAVDGTIESAEFELVSAAGVASLGFVTLDGATSAEQSVRFGSAAAALADLEDEFNNIRAQIDQLVTDTGYRGTNLLNGDNLLTTFNENRSSSLTTDGVTYNSDGLGLDEANFSRTSTVDASLDAAREALLSVRSFGETLANDLSVIQTRETFTKALINTLTEGSDKLVNADQNEEGAKLLALQTRQSLGVTSLSLASQSQQSILRLF